MLKKLNDIATLYAYLEAGKKHGTKAVPIDKVIELVDILGHTYTELMVYKTLYDQADIKSTYTKNRIH